MSRFMKCTQVAPRKGFWVNMDTIRLIEPVHGGGSHIRFIDGSFLTVINPPEHFLEDERVIKDENPLYLTGLGYDDLSDELVANFLATQKNENH